MPPWPADPAYSNFLDEHHLSEEQLAIINLWVEGGLLIGDTAKLPVPPVFAAGSMIGKSDLVLKIKPLLVEGDHADRFMVMKIPFE